MPTPASRFGNRISLKRWFFGMMHLDKEPNDFATCAIFPYLNAVIKHDTSAAPLFLGFRQTDYAVVVRPGTGLWKSITGLGKVQRKYFNAVIETTAAADQR